MARLRPRFGFDQPSDAMAALGVTPEVEPSQPKKKVQAKAKPKSGGEARKVLKASAQEPAAATNKDSGLAPTLLRPRESRLAVQPRVPEAAFKKLKRLAFELRQAGTEAPIWELVAAATRTIPTDEAEAWRYVEQWREAVGRQGTVRRHLHVEIPREIHNRLEQLAFELDQADRRVSLWELYAAALADLPNDRRTAAKLIDQCRTNGTAALAA